VDPTKTRPSGEALLRRVLHGNELPRISTVVDAYNLASMKTIIPISGFDADLVDQPFHVRFAGDGEVFSGIGMTKPMPLKNNALVLTDERQILCIYPYRDSDRSKITLQTRNVLITAYGSPGITENQLRNAVETTLSHIKQTSHGETTLVKTFSTTRDETS
jgi:DNA/RNA-binding domain of Phe-tRNA-synthetase-like protein